MSQKKQSSATLNSFGPGAQAAFHVVLGLFALLCIVPFVFDDPKDYDRLQAGDALALTNIRAAVEGDGKATFKAGNSTFTATAALSAREKHLLLCGGLLASLR